MWPTTSSRLLEVSCRNKSKKYFEKAPWEVWTLILALTFENIKVMVLKSAEHFKEREVSALILQNSEYIIISKRSEETKIQKLNEKQWVSNMVRKFISFPQPKCLILESHLYTCSTELLLHHLQTAAKRCFSAAGVINGLILLLVLLKNFQQMRHYRKKIKR